MNFEQWWADYVKREGLENHQALALLKETAKDAWNLRFRVEYRQKGKVVDAPSLNEVVNTYASNYGINHDDYRIVG